MALGASWARPIRSFDNAAPFWSDLGDQVGFESYWKILMTPDLWVTPGFRMIFDPAFQPDTDVLAIAQIKFRLFF